MSKFEDRLWRDLVRRHGADLAQMTRPAAKRARRPRPRLLAGTSVAVAGVGTVAALLLSAASSPPAFAVSRNADGTYTVRLQQIAAIHGANAKLAALGIRARIVEVSPGCAYRVLPPAAVRAMQLAKGIAASDALKGSTTRVDPREIPAGKLQVLPAVRVAGHVNIAPARLAAASAPTCVSTLPQTVVARCAPGTPQHLKSAPALPTYSGEIRRALGKTSATVHLLTGNSGNSGNSGAPGSTHAQTPVKNPPNWVVIGCQIHTSPPAGNGGNSGNSGNSGTSGNS